MKTKLKSRAIANEKTNLFCVKLKRPYLTPRYLTSLQPGSREVRLPKSALKREFLINQIAFFRKHVWYGFCGQNMCGWVPLKNFRKNYCRLVIPLSSQRLRISNDWRNVLLLCRYKRPSKNLAPLVERARRTPREKTWVIFTRVLIHWVGTFRDLSRKSTRRIRDQVVRRRPVIIWVRGLHHRSLQSIIVIGFNRRVFFYLDFLSGEHLQTITRNHLLKIWRKAGYRGLSC